MPVPDIVQQVLNFKRLLDNEGPPTRERIIYATDEDWRELGEYVELDLNEDTVGHLFGVTIRRASKVQLNA